MLTYLKVIRAQRTGPMVLGALLVVVLGGASRSARADEAREEDLEREVEDLKRRLEALEEGREAEGRERLPPAPSDPEGRPQEVEVHPPWSREPIEKPAPLRGIYDKPFLLSAWQRMQLGGYTELEYHAFRDGILGLPRGFRAHRTNLFAFADVADRVRFGSEIEFENEEVGEDLEVKVEMAFIDWVIFEELTLRGGAILVPLGRINLNHDGPVRELTDRPLVSTFVIPSTLTEPGAGAHGAIDLAERLGLGADLGLSYEAYVTNGFRLLDREGELAAPVIDREQLLREGRPSLGGDFNDSVAGTGRIGIEALKALSAGGSWHVGAYDERDDNLLSIIAGDLAWVHGDDPRRGIVSLEGEVAWAGFERDAFARTAGVPEEFWGLYLQASASHMPGFLREGAPHLFGDERAAFTLVLRYDRIDVQGDVAEALEPGLSFRPIADTVIKFSYRVSLNSLGLRDVPGRRGFDDDGFVCSFTSYF